ncbi:MAG: nucleoside transporter C-terminal domain-containing protein, partial [Bacteroidota bacterium]
DDFFMGIAEGFVTIVGYAEAGSAFVFNSLGTAEPEKGSLGFFFAFQVLPIIIFFSALTSGLYYLGVLQRIVKAFAWIMARTMRLSGAESISAAGNVFLGQTEAPLLVKPYIEGMTRSELMCLMTGGMATIAGSVMAAYIKMMGGTTDMALNLLTASLMNAPAAIVVAKILIPEENPDAINTDLSVSSEKIGANFIDAIANGTSQGLQLALNVGAMLIAFVALIYMVNGLFGWVGEITNLNTIIKETTKIAAADGSTVSAFDGLSLEYLVGQLFRPLAFAIGIEWKDTLLVGSFLGTKVIVNEFIAYSSLSGTEAGVISERSRIISAFALCGFANFSSIAIQIAGIGGIAPNQRVTLSKLGLLAVLGGTLASMMSASVAGIFL